MLMTLTHSLFPAWAKWISWRSSTGNHQIIGRRPPYFFFPREQLSFSWSKTRVLSVGGAGS